MRKLALVFLVLALPLAFAPTATAGGWDDCEGWERDRGSKGRYCEVREMEFEAFPALTIDAGNNGGIRVEAWDGPGIQMTARVQVWETSEEKGASKAAAIQVHQDGGRIWADGNGQDNWSVSYRIKAPRQTDLDLEAHNGGIAIREIEGTLRLSTHNGGLSLSGLAGDVEARTRNGGVKVELTGAFWEGEKLDVETRNGGVKLEIPSDYSAQLATGTVNGRIEIDFPVTVQGRIDREIEATLGSGGAPIRVKTTNGSVRVRKM